MTLLPNRTAVAQVMLQLREAISAGTWREWLPNERELCRDLQVSRSTLRQALTQLAREGFTKPHHGVGHQILKTRQHTDHADTQIQSFALLSPLPLTQLRPSIALWVDELKDLLHAAGYQLHFHCNRSLYQSDSGAGLQRLLRREPHTCWILVLASAPMQQWFAQRDIPCLIAGSLYPGIRLPSIDVDYRAVTRHAAGVLLRHGHRKIMLFNRSLQGAGEIESEIGFLEAARTAPHADVEPMIVRYEESVNSVVNYVRRFLEQKKRPTGLIVANSNYYLATVTELTRRGMRIPADISVISRDDDPFLNYMLPAPARYLNDPRAFAAKCRTLALQIVEHGMDAARHVRIIPRFEAGESVGRAPATEE